MGVWAGWEADVLAAVRAPNTADSRRFLDAWQGYEGGTARFNPLNTTQPYAGATDYNSVGVKNYRTDFDGAQATAQTLENGRYPTIVAALRSGNPYSYPEAQAIAAEIRTWGTFAFATAFVQGAAPAQPGTTSGSGGAKAPRGHGGYLDLRNSLARHLPTQLEQSRQLRLAALRTLGRRRKVRR